MQIIMKIPQREKILSGNFETRKHAQKDAREE